MYNVNDIPLDFQVLHVPRKTVQTGLIHTSPDEYIQSDWPDWMKKPRTRNQEWSDALAETNSLAEIHKTHKTAPTVAREYDAKTAGLLRLAYCLGRASAADEKSRKLQVAKVAKDMTADQRSTLAAITQMATEGAATVKP